MTESVILDACQMDDVVTGAPEQMADDDDDDTESTEGLLSYIWREFWCIVVSPDDENLEHQEEEKTQKPKIDYSYDYLKTCSDEATQIFRDYCVSGIPVDVYFRLRPQMGFNQSNRT